MLKKERLIHIYSDQGKVIADARTGELFTDILINEDDTREFIETKFVISKDKDKRANYSAFIAEHKINKIIEKGEIK